MSMTVDRIGAQCGVSTRGPDMIEDMLLPLTHTEGDDAAFETAISMAVRLGAHLTVIEPVSLPMPLPEGWWAIPHIETSQTYVELRNAGFARAARLRERLEKEAISYEVRIMETFLTEPSQLIVLHALCTDLCVLGLPASRVDGAISARRLFDALLLESGRPVLVVPQGHAIEFPPHRAVIAWHPAREAARALQDALPLLRGASFIDVAIVNPAADSSRNDRDPGANVVAHLARHGLKAEVVTLRDRGEGTAATLLRHATRSGSDLLVAGGFGHSRLQEWMLGGTTRELLQESHLPVLFSH